MLKPSISRDYFPVVGAYVSHFIAVGFQGYGRAVELSCVLVSILNTPRPTGSCRYICCQSIYIHFLAVGCRRINFRIEAW